MKKLFPLLYFFFLSLCASAQNFSIDGITGISFSESDSNYNLTITESFTAYGILVAPNNVTLNYNSVDNSFDISGAVEISFDDEVINTDLELSVSNRVIESLLFDINNDFQFKDLTISPDTFGFEWDKTNQQFEMFGTIDSSIESNDISLSLGDADSPGIIIQNGIVESIDMRVTSNFDLYDLTLNPNDLTFSYNKSSDQFEMYGNLTVTFDSESMDVNLGDSDSPGLLYKTSSIEALQFGITADFELKGITFSPENLSFDWDKNNNYFEIYGALNSTIDGNDLALSLGDSDTPGLVITNGILTDFNAGITADFNLKGFEFKPTDLTFQYTKSSNQFEMYGALDVAFDGESVAVNLGDASVPGLIYKNKIVEEINFGVTEDFRLKNLLIKADNLTFFYKKSGNQFEMYGDIKITFSSNTVEADMGDSSDPGFIYKNGKITQVNIGITEDFKMSGLHIQAKDLGVEWQSDNVYHVFGDADLSIAHESIDADFGTSSDPGFIIRDDHWHYFNVDINSDIKLGNLEVIAKDLDIKYDGKFEVTGELEVKEVFSLAVTLGKGNQAGLEVDVSGSEPRFKVEDLTIDIEHANLGALDLKQLKLEFNSHGIVESDVKVTFPEGWEVDADLKFAGNPAKIDAIDIAYRADNLAEAIEIFEGVQLTYLEGNVKNITHPSKLEVGGTIGTIYGGGFTLAGKSATFLEMTDEVTVTKSSFDIKGDVNVGAYRSGTNSWHSILGHGDIDFYARFGHYVKVNADAKYPGDPLIEADINAYLDNHGHFDALLDVEFIVPHWVPFIGGKHYGSIDGAVRYKKGYLHDSFGAAWVRIKTFWHTYHVGAKYNFGSRHVSSIGSGSISSIQRTIQNDERKGNSKKTAATTSVVHTFTVPQPTPNSMLIDIDWDGEVSEALVHVIGPEGIYELTKAVVLEENDISTTPTMGYEENMTTIVKDTVTTFLLTTPSAFSQEEIIHSDLIQGRYQLVISFPDVATEIDTIQIKPKWQFPAAEITATKNDENEFDLDIAYWSSLPDSTYVSFYANTTASYEDSRLINHIKASNFDDEGYGVESLTYAPHTFENTTNDLYFYAVIEDGVNPPLTSEITSSYSHTPDLHGTISFSNSVTDLDLTGLRIFVDEDDDGFFDTKSTGGLEKFSLSNLTGEFSFRDLDVGTYPIRVVLPDGYRITGHTDRFSSLSITFDGTPIELNFEIETY
ncbi:hypothetical protein [Flavicella marina]|uniref:hypothetical protein n=1 Tax=Flavicella marina TaxID=1475951 RepID=UPI001263F662|nr:hypothetical protein [Flavicella marina]